MARKCPRVILNKVKNLDRMLGLPRRDPSANASGWHLRAFDRGV